MSHSRDELKAELMKKAEAAIEKLLAEQKPAGAITLTDIEQLVKKAGEEIKRELTRTLVERSTEQPPATEVECPACGVPMRSKGRKPKRVVTETGEVTVKRVYYYCERCQRGIFPPG